MVGARNGGRECFGCDETLGLGCEGLASGGIEVMFFGFEMFNTVVGVPSSGGGLG